MAETSRGCDLMGLSHASFYTGRIIVHMEVKNE